MGDRRLRRVAHGVQRRRPSRPTGETSTLSSIWAERAAIADPASVQRKTLRRYLASLATRRRSKRTIARAAASLRRYFGWLQRTGRIDTDPSTGLSAPRGERRLPHVLRADELHVLLDDPPARGRRTIRKRCGCATTPCSSCSTAADFGSASSVDCASRDVDPARRRATIWGKGSKQRTRAPQRTGRDERPSDGST